MAQANQTIWKGATAVLGLAVTVMSVVAVANQDWGKQTMKLDTVAVTVEKHTIQIECHDREIATLKANLSNLLERQKESNEKLDELLKRLPPQSRSAVESAGGNGTT